MWKMLGLKAHIQQLIFIELYNNLIEKQHKKGNRHRRVVLVYAIKAYAEFFSCNQRSSTARPSANFEKKFFRANALSCLAYHTELRFISTAFGLQRWPNLTRRTFLKSFRRKFMHRDSRIRRLLRCMHHIFLRPGVKAKRRIRSLTELLM